jgi:hypothetical protein
MDIVIEEEMWIIEGITYIHSFVPESIVEISDRISVVSSFFLSYIEEESFIV